MIWGIQFICLSWKTIVLCNHGILFIYPWMISASSHTTRTDLIFVNQRAAEKVFAFFPYMRYINQFLTMCTGECVVSYNYMKITGKIYR